MAAIKDMNDYELVNSGTGACAGCPSPIALRIIGKALGPETVMVMTPSCAVASTGLAPNSCYNVPVQNICFAAAGASASAISSTFDVLLRKGRIESKPTVMNWVGDGGTYDIGFQGISAAAERNDDIIHFCYNNEAYSNTGMQRSGATPQYAITSTTPFGKDVPKKNMPLLMLDHNIPYMATASIAYPMDLYRKVQKAKSIKGFKYIEISAPCFTGWKFDAKDTITYSKMAVKSNSFILWEAEFGKVSFNSPTKQIVEGKVEPSSLRDYLKDQGRFRDLFKRDDVDEILQAMIDANNEYIEILKTRV